MNRTIYIILVAVTLFGGINVLDLLGISQNIYQAVMISIAVLLMFKNKRYFMWDRIFLSLVASTCLFCLYKLLMDTGEGTRVAVLAIIGAPLCFAMYPKLYGKTLLCQNRDIIMLWRRVAKIAFIFFLVETGMAVVERLTGKNMIGWNGLSQMGMDAEFRSTALWGHPLYNALIVSTFMLFILVSDFKLKYKFGFFFLGFFAILCFNTRGSIVGNALMLLVYVLHYAFLEKRISVQRIMQQLCFLIIMGIVCYILVFSQKFGGRLLDMGLFDDSSAQTRIDVWQIFQYYDLKDFLFGLTMRDIDWVKFSVGIKVTENFMIDWILKFGLIFTVGYIYLFALFIRRLYRGYSRFSVFFTSCGFFLIAFTNNNLSVNYSALLIYLLLIVVFNPVYLNKIIPRKYLVN